MVTRPKYTEMIRREASLEIFSLLKLEPLEMKFESCFLKISKIYIFSHFCGVSVLISFLIFSLLYYFCLFCHITARCVFLLKLSPSRTIPFCFGFVLQNFVYVCLLWALRWEMRKKFYLLKEINVNGLFCYIHFLISSYYCKNI